MLNSLTSRLIGLAVLVSVAMLVAAALLLSSSDRMRRGFLYVGQNEGVIREVDELLGDLWEAESGQRGFLITHSPAYLDGFNERTASAARRTAALQDLVQTEAIQTERVKRLRALVADRIASLRVPLRHAERQDFAAATAYVASGRGRALMEEVAREAEEIKAAEQSLLTLRLEEAVRRAQWNHDVIMMGGPLLAIAFFMLIYLLLRSVRRPLDNLSDAIQRLTDGDTQSRARTGSGVREVDGLAVAYNAMADRLFEVAQRQTASDAQLQLVNQELRNRGSAIELLGGMAHRMQASRTSEELAEVLGCYLPRVLPDAPGALFVHNNSRNLLVQLASWGTPYDLPDHFAPDECWALRRGQGHHVDEGGSDVRCRHVPDFARYHCEPVLAGGEVIGLLYLEGAITTENRFRLVALTENIALALVNQRLQRGLREQSIRDALTGLFNRRYMEEALATEIARAHRNAEPLGLVMCDVDHFKRYNDEHGHAAGDRVLKAVSAAMAERFREGDVVCRYGGEEFAIIAPATELAALLQRAEELRESVSGLRIRHEGRALAGVTLSLGVAILRPSEGGEELMRAADRALYRAKQEGRDRVILDSRHARLAA